MGLAAGDDGRAQPDAFWLAPVNAEGRSLGRDLRRAHIHAFCRLKGSVSESDMSRPQLPSGRVLPMQRSRREG